MPIEQAILTWIHLIAAAIWVGGSIFIGIVFSPILKTITTTVEERIQKKIQQSCSSSINYFNDYRIV
jgi:uncharacterized membrane protein